MIGKGVKYPFFVPPPKLDDTSAEGEKKSGLEKDDVAVADENSKELAAKKSIENIVSSQQLKDVPVQVDLFTDNELKGEDANEMEEGS